MTDAHDAAADAESHTDAVVVEGLTVTRRGTTILDDVSCRLPRGRVTALLGHNGCGKTTLTRCILGSMFGSAGRITVLGERLGQTDIRELRRRIGVVNPVVDTGEFHTLGAVVDADLTTTEACVTGFFGTVGLYDTPTQTQIDRARTLLSDVGLAHRLDHRFSLLSTGEQRRGLIARALTQKPELLILDEPTAGLDIAGREHVLATLSRLLAQPDAPAVLFISHHVEELPPQTAKVILMSQGKFIAEGTPEEVITPETLSDAFGCKVYVKQTHGRYWLEVLPEAWKELLP